MHVRRLGDDVGYRPTVTKANLKHMVARRNAELRDGLCIALPVSFVQPFCDREASVTLRITELLGPFGRGERIEDDHRSFPLSKGSHTPSSHARPGPHDTKILCARAEITAFDPGCVKIASMIRFSSDLAGGLDGAFCRWR
jgi:hypothetical protein